MLVNGIKSSPGPHQMAAPFVPVPFPACRFWTRRGSPIHAASPINCELSPPESISWMTGVGPWGAKVGIPLGVLDGSCTLAEGEGSIGHSWEEGRITPTLLGYEILEERAKFTVWI